MEYFRRLVLNKATPTEYETQMSKSDKLDYLALRKTKLSMVIFLSISDLIKTIYLLQEYETKNSKAILAAIIAINILVVCILISMRIKWYSNYTFTLGFAAFGFDVSKLSVLLVPYIYTIQELQDVIFICVVILPWCVPYLTIARLFKSNSYLLKEFSNNLFNVWKVLSIIYIPLAVFLYSIVINIVPFVLFWFNLPKALISIVYVLWGLNMLEMIAANYEKNRLSLIISWLWTIILAVALYELSEDIYVWVINFAVSSIITGMKLNMLSKDVLCYITNIMPEKMYLELDSVV